MTALAVPDVLYGVQTPRIGSYPDYRHGLGGEVVDLASAAGIDLDPWQRYTIERSFGVGPNGKWSAFEVALVVPRQCGKGEVLLAMQLAGLFLFRDDLILHTAHEVKTAIEAMTRLVAVIRRNEWMDSQVHHVHTGKGFEEIGLKDGRRIKFIARSKGAGRGFTADRLFFDEAYALTSESIAALLPTLATRKRAQITYASSAGMTDSSQLQALRERGIKGESKSLAYFEWSADPRADLDDRDAWAQANPGLGYRIDEDFIAKEREASPEAEFARERLGIWDDASRQSVIPLDVWQALQDRGSQVAGSRVALALDVNPDRSAAALAVCGRRADGVAHVEVPWTGRPEARGGSPLVEECVRAFRSLRTPVRVTPSGPAGSFIPTLREAGVTVLEVSDRGFVQACGGFFDTVMAGGLRHLDDPRLTAAVVAARKRPVGEAWAWTRRDFTDISPLVAATLALHGVAETAAASVRRRYHPQRI